MLTLLFFILVGIIVLSYFFYGSFLSKNFYIDDSRPTPSQTMEDGIDYVPAHKAVLFGHHFSAIAGAGPIIGPIIAGMSFGWLPALIWIVIGSIFIGGVHDFSVLTASMRHRGDSIANIARTYINERSRKFFLLFVWFALIYVITIFTDITAETFVDDGGIATSSIFYILLAVLFGLSIYKFKLPMFRTSLIFVILVFLGIWFGQVLPVNLYSKKLWAVVLLIYCFFASVLPVWLLLQPRDYLSSYLLFASVLAGVLGILLGGFDIKSSSFKGFHSDIGYLFPILFITIACGAISGFHSLVASGTTSKQISKESHARFIAYGGMLLEGIVALIALSGVMMFTGDFLKGKQPMEIYSLAMGNFFQKIGLSYNFGHAFGFLAISAFVLTTLDASTRIARYVLQEFMGGIEKVNRFLATFITLIIPTIFVFIEFKDPSGNVIPAWKAIWPAFGTSNQLLAALALLTVYAWLRKNKWKTVHILLPMIFMFLTTLTALVLLILKFKLSIVGIIAILLFFIAVFLLIDTVFPMVYNRKNE
jgi:carbon starvation protein